MISIRGIYDGKKLRLQRPVKIRSARKVIVTFLDEDDEITSEELHHLAENGGALKFLSKKEEDIYSDKDLKTVYR